MSVDIVKIWAFAKEWFWITVGLALYACALNLFVLPHGFVGGGFGGISTMIYYVTGIPMFVSYLGFNVILCAIAYVILGKEFSIKTVAAILILSVLLAIIKIPEIPIIGDKLLSGIMGGIVAGAGISTYLLHGASTGGSDIVVLIISKYKNVSLGRIYLIFDACVIASSILLPDGSIENVAYGFVFMGVSAYALDTISNGRRQSVQMFIFTNKYSEICDAIIHKHRRGATLLESIGWFTKQHTKTVFLVARKREAQAIFKTVKSIDDRAFIAVSNVMSVFGIGFDPIKAGFSKKQHAAEALPKAGALPEDNAVPQPPDAPQEVPANSEILADEVEALRRYTENSKLASVPGEDIKPKYLN
jgi:uncharacterized membrane-anchored protein YitT (DUF2179 family)